MRIAQTVSDEIAELDAELEITLFLAGETREAREAEVQAAIERVS